MTAQPEIIACFLCAHPGLSWDYESLDFISGMKDLCEKHKESIDKKLNPNVTERDPGCEG